MAIKIYFLWGPRGYTSESMIVRQSQQGELEKIIRISEEGRQSRPPVFHALRTLRRVSTAAT